MRVKYEFKRIISGSGDLLEVAAQRFFLNKFYELYSHKTIQNFLWYINDRNIARFYCGLPSERCINIKEIISISVNDIDIPNVFYDNPIFFEIPDNFPKECIKILLNNKVIGYYFPERNLLFATDWVHDDACLSVIEMIIDKLPFKTLTEFPKKIFTITIGADPEFEVVRQDEVVRASDVISGGIHDRVGVDGAGDQVELRPEPAETVQEAVKNFRKLLMEFAKRYTQMGISLTCQGDRYPLGGHIHIGVPFDYTFIKVLDNWIGKKVINLSGYARGSYKILSAYEEKNWGFEYRTPPAAIFHNPKVLSSVYKIVKALAEHYYNADGVEISPTSDEIRRLGLEKEYEILDDFIRNYDKIPKNVLKAWRIARRIKFEVDIVFRDDWDNEVKEYYKNRLSAVVNERINKAVLSRRKIRRIILFGFKQERGLVCNFDSEILQKIDFEYFHYSDERVFGLPYDLRVCDLNEKREIIDKVIVEIIKNLNLKIRS